MAGPAGFVVQSAYANLFPYKNDASLLLTKSYKSLFPTKSSPLQNDPVLEALSLEGVQKCLW